MASTLERATDWALVISPGAFGLAAGSALALSLVFGVLPARRAASLDPIASLRAE